MGDTDPIVLDLDGNGVNLTSLQASNAFFDIFGTGAPVRMGWVGAGDALLARDANSDGQITEQNEINFKNAVPGGQSSLEGLRGFDSNGDGAITALDQLWSTFRVWRDLNGDGVSDAGELQTLDEAGLASISLANNGVFEAINGNAVHGSAVATRVDGSTLQAASVNFDVEITLLPSNLGPNREILLERTKPVRVVVPNVTGTSGDDTLLGGEGADTIQAGEGNDSIAGLGGDDLLDGGLGADQLAGGAGNDAYIIDDIADFIVEAANQGVDTVKSTINYTLTDNVERLVLGGADAITGTGNALDNILVGNDAANQLTGGAGNDSIEGRAGADSMSGGIGDDLYLVDDVGDLVLENAGEGVDTVLSAIDYTLTANVENLTLGGVGAVGVGNALSNTLTGSAVNNFLDGGAGADTMIGGAGDDIFVVDSAADRVVENQYEGVDLVRASVSYTLTDSVENLLLTGTQGLTGTGNATRNIIVGNSAGNRIDGGAGADTLGGGGGDDTYIVDDSSDVVFENVGEGSDAVFASASYTIAENIETLTLTGVASIDGTGNALDNTISGNSGANRLSGGVGADTLIGGAGDDTYVVDDVDDSVVETPGQGVDEVRSSITYTIGSAIENLTLTGSASIDGTGNSLDNIITGNSWNNLLVGGAGADTMIGGRGADTYVVDDARDQAVENHFEGVDIVLSSVNYTLSGSIENLTLTGASALSGTGKRSSQRMLSELR